MHDAGSRRGAGQERARGAQNDCQQADKSWSAQVPQAQSPTSHLKCRKRARGRAECSASRCQSGRSAAGRRPQSCSCPAGGSRPSCRPRTSPPACRGTAMANSSHKCAGRHEARATSCAATGKPRCCAHCRQGRRHAARPHLRHDGGGDLDEVHAALVGSRRKAGHVADHAATQGDEGGVAVQPAGVGSSSSEGQREFKLS